MVCSRGSTPALTPNPSSFIHTGGVGGNNRIKAANIPLLLQLQDPSNNGTATAAASISRNASDDVAVDDDEPQNSKPLNDDC